MQMGENTTKNGTILVIKYQFKHNNDVELVFYY